MSTPRSNFRSDRRRALAKLRWVLLGSSVVLVSSWLGSGLLLGERLLYRSIATTLAREGKSAVVVAHESRWPGTTSATIFVEELRKLGIRALVEDPAGEGEAPSSLAEPGRCVFEIRSYASVVATTRIDCGYAPLAGWVEESTKVFAFRGWITVDRAEYMW